MVAVAAALVVGACGGTDWNAAKQPKTPSAAQLRAAAVAQAKAESPYVAALVASDQGSSDPSNPADARCWAAALVHGFGVSAFVAHGLTPNGLRDPDSTLDALPTPTLAQADAIGAALQRCRLSAVGAGLAQSLGANDAASAACMTRALGRPEARRFLTLSMLGSHRMNLATAHTFVGLAAGCVDLAAFVVRIAGFPPDAAIRQCVTTALHGADAEVKDFLALVFSDADHDQIEQASDALGVAMNQCRPGAQTGFTVPPS